MSAESHNSPGARCLSVAEAKAAARAARLARVEAAEAAAQEAEPADALHLAGVEHARDALFEMARAVTLQHIARGEARGLERSDGWRGLIALDDAHDALEALCVACWQGAPETALDDAAAAVEGAIWACRRAAALDCGFDPDDDGPCEDQSTEVSSSDVRSLVGAALECDRLHRLAVAGAIEPLGAFTLAAQQFVWARPINNVFWN